MPETPDFDQIARSIVDLWGEPIDSTVIEEEAIAEQLRLIWNARGTADIAELDHTISSGVDPSMKVIDQILRALDR